VSVDFEIIGEIQNVETIAVGSRIHALSYCHICRKSMGVDAGGNSKALLK